MVFTVLLSCSRFRASASRIDLRTVSQSLRLLSWSTQMGRERSFRGAVQFLNVVPELTLKYPRRQSLPSHMTAALLVSLPSFAVLSVPAARTGPANFAVHSVRLGYLTLWLDRMSSRILSVRNIEDTYRKASRKNRGESGSVNSLEDRPKRVDQCECAP